MKRIKPYDGDSVNFYKNVANYSMKGATLDAIAEQIENSYRLYDQQFTLKKLGTLIPNGFSTSDAIKNDLKKLYSFRKKDIRRLFQELTTGKYNRLSSKCPYCFRGEVSSFDHFLPKELFPEYSVHPRNLVPACSRCNQYKSIEYKDVFNPYIDDVPILAQYLFVKFQKLNDDFLVEYYLDNSNGIESSLFKRIENTFAILDLANRYKEASSDLFVMVSKDIKLEKKGDLDEIKIKERLLFKYKELYGCDDVNNWEYVFRVACLQDIEVYEYLFNFTT